MQFCQLQEALSSIATVRTFGGENYEKKRFEELGRWSLVKLKLIKMYQYCVMTCQDTLMFQQVNIIIAGIYRLELSVFKERLLSKSSHKGSKITGHLKVGWS